MLKLYGFARVNKGARGNTRDLRVLWTLEELGLPRRQRPITLPSRRAPIPSVIS